LGQTHSASAFESHDPALGREFSQRNSQALFVLLGPSWIAHLETELDDVTIVLVTGVLRPEGPESRGRDHERSNGSDAKSRE
jgi:hypothetical protein